MCTVHRAPHHARRTMHTGTVHRAEHSMRFDGWQRERTALVDVDPIEVEKAANAEERHERVVLLAHVDLAHISREATQRVRKDVPAGERGPRLLRYVRGVCGAGGSGQAAHRSASRGILKASRASSGSVTLCAGLRSPWLSHSCRLALHHSSTFSSVASAT